eukprot:26874_1
MAFIACQSPMNLTVVEAGDDFEKWIQLCKQQLRERETKLMVLRTSTLQSIINAQCVYFQTINSSKCSAQHKIAVTNYDKVITDSLISQCLDKLNQLLSLWHGINLRKTKRPPATFQKYFAIAKCWFDQKKKVILAPDFWIKFFIHLQQFASDAASRCFDNRFQNIRQLFAKQLLFQLLSGIFAGELPYSGTKGQPLVACAIVKDNRAMKDYLHSLHHTLNIDTLKQTGASHALNAKDLLEVLNAQLASLTKQFHMEFQAALKALSNGVHPINTNPQTSDSNSPRSTMSLTSSFVAEHPATTNNADKRTAPQPQSYVQPHVSHAPNTCQCQRHQYQPWFDPQPMRHRQGNYNRYPAPVIPYQNHHMQHMPHTPVQQPRHDDRTQRMRFERYMNAHSIPNSHESQLSHGIFYNPSMRAPHVTTGSNIEAIPVAQLPPSEHVSAETVEYPDAPPVVPDLCAPLEPFDPFDLVSPDPFVSFDTMPEENYPELYGLNGTYNGNHAVSQSVMTQRFSPMNTHAPRTNTHSHRNYI